MCWRWLLICCIPFALLGQTTYPSSIDTDASLLVARDRASSSLAAGINSIVTTFQVASTSTFASNMVVTIGTEQIYCTSFSGTTFSGCTRGYNGTTAATHEASSGVRGYITSAHHEVLKDAIIAVQTALGAALANVLNQNTTGSAASLAAQYIDWSASSGGASIANKPTLGTSAALDVGTTTGTVAAGDHNHSEVYEPVDATIVRSSGDRTENAITIYDASGNVVASDCSISGGTVTCGDGTEAAMVALRELAANGTSEFGIYGAESLAADACIQMPATQPTEGQILKASASTATPTGTALTCRVMEWATDTAPAMVGDSGSGGTAGLVPAPEAGDAAAGKYLKADGTWGVPPGGGGTGSIVLLAGYRQATTTRANWNISGASVETIGASEPYRQASISFRDANDDIASTWFVFPYDWDGETDPTITIHHSGAASQNVVVETSFSCPVADGATWSVAADPTFNAATSTTLTGPGSAARLIKQDTTAVDTTGCVPGSLAFIKVQRKGSDGSDGTGTWYLYAAEVVYAK